MEERGTPTMPHNRALDGLRGIAVIVVLLYHFMPSWMPGGFLGVSLFFTLSGYLITQILVAGGSSRHGAWRRLGTFWSRRLRRLAPASLCCLLAIAIVGSTTDWFASSGLRGDIVWSTLYSANWRFATGSVGYADAIAGSPSPVLHFWSLAIEEQFYVVFPLLVVGLLALGLRRRHLAIVFALLAAGSTALAIAANSQKLAYYGTHTRAVELLAGSLLALVLPLGSADRLAGTARRSAMAGGALALAAIAAACLWVRDTDAAVYGGWLAAFAIASVLVICGAVVGGPVRWLGERAPLEYAGRTSYGLYLFHWPVMLILTPERVGFGGIGLLAVRLGATVAISLASFTLLEQPIRRRRFAMPALAGGGFAAAMAVTLAVGLGVPVSALPTGDADLAGLDAPSGPVEFGAAESPQPQAVPVAAEAAAPDSPEAGPAPAQPIEVAIDGAHAEVAGWLERTSIAGRPLHISPIGTAGVQLEVRVADETDRTNVTAAYADLVGDARTVEEFAAADRVAAELGEPRLGVPILIVNTGPAEDALGGSLHNLDLERDDLSVVTMRTFEADAMARAAGDLLRAADSRRRVLVIGDSTSFGIASSLDRVAGDRLAVLWAGGRNCPLVEVEELRWWDGAQWSMDECPGVDRGWKDVVAEFEPEVVLAIASVPEQSEQRYAGDAEWHVAGDETFHYVHQVGFEQLQSLLAPSGALTLLATSPLVGKGAMAGAQFAKADRVKAWNTELAGLDRQWNSTAMVDLASLIASAEREAGHGLRRDGVHMPEADLDRYVTPQFADMVDTAYAALADSAAAAGCRVERRLDLERCRAGEAAPP